MSTFERRRPPSLLDTAIAATPLSTHSNGVNGYTHSNGVNVDFGSSNEFKASMQRLRRELDNAFQRHHDEMQQSVRFWMSRHHGSWRCADGRPRSSSGVVTDSAWRQIPGQPETPKLDPPPSSHTPVNTTDLLRKIAEEKDKLMLPENMAADDTMSSSVSSTRCGSLSGMDVPQHSEDSMPKHISEDNLPTTVIGLQSNVMANDVPFPPGRPLESPAMFSRPADDPPPLLMRGMSGHFSAFSGSNKDKTPLSLSPGASSRVKRRQKSGALFSPLSKRKMEVLETKQTFCERISRSRIYESVNAAVIILNAIFILWETESRANLAAFGKTASEFQDNELWFTVAATVFVIVFMVDVVLRIIREGLDFLFGRERFWNGFDVFVTLTAAVEVMVQWILYASASDSGFGLRMHLRKFSMLRIVRMLRVIRTARAVRLLRFIRELRLMVMSLGHAFQPLFWSVVLVMIILLIFGVFFTDGTVAYCVEHAATDNDATVKLRRYFGTLFSSTLSLYMAMTGGEDWATVYHALDLLPLEYRQLFLVFVTFAILALLNVVTAVFVGTAMQRSQHDAELMIQQELENKDEFVSTLQQVFDELDTNGSGALSFEEFEQHMNDEKITAYLRTLDINVSQVCTLFTLLDVDQTGEVDIDEFATGLLRLKGGATSMDMAVLRYQLEWIHHNVMQLQTLIAKN